MHVELRLSVLRACAVRPEARDLCACAISVVTQIRHRVSMDMSFWLQLYCEVCEHTLDTGTRRIVHKCDTGFMNFVESNTVTQRRPAG